ncbi:SPOR domain-containing protein [Calditrichota bacterium LG25]
MKILIKEKTRLLTSGILIIFTLSVALFADENWQQWLKLYQSGQYAALKQRLEQVSPEPKNSLEYLFFKTLFIKDGARAVKNYQMIFEKSSGWLKHLAAQKLHDYYFALGLYLKAEGYASFIKEAPQEKASNPRSYKTDDPKYVIQFGAFSSMDNARKRQKELSQKRIDSQIVVRKINNKNFYCVWVKGGATFADTDQLAKQLKKQLGIEYRIIKE